MEQIDVAVIGGGVTGLAAARAIAQQGYSTCVLERHPRPGLDTSTHNSGVIHAGLYHPTGTLKAKLCVEGRQLLYEFCGSRRAARLSKLIVAHDETGFTNSTLQRRGTANASTARDRRSRVHPIPRTGRVGRGPPCGRRTAASSTPRSW
jgi:L-2-hydroxyglutarate oxidase LhgO